MSADERREPDERDLAGKDPLEVLRSVLAISPEDAEHARKDAAKKMESDARSGKGKRSESG